jgi:hypothetical protein
MIPDLRLNEWWEYLLVGQETTKNVLCQEKSGFSNSLTVDDSGLEKWNNMGNIS